jgi:hypothetical protein
MSCAGESETACVPADQCGVVCDQATVVFRDGTTPQRVDEINAEIGASIVTAPLLSTAYRIKLPVGTDFDIAQEFYSSKQDVVSVVRATNFCPN